MTPEVEQAILPNTTMFGVKKVLKALPNYLAPGEQVEAITSGAYGGANGIIAITDRQVILLGKWAFKTEAATFNRDTLTGVTQKAGPMFTQLTVRSAGQEATIKNILNEHARQLIQMLQ